jgi:6-phosphogluconate dehydrogenase (decarboxylating)
MALLMEMGIIGLGKMGGNLARQALEGEDKRTGRREDKKTLQTEKTV